MTETEKEKTQYQLTYGHDSLILWCTKTDTFCTAQRAEGKIHEWYGAPTDAMEVLMVVSKHRSEHFGLALAEASRAIAGNLNKITIFNKHGIADDTPKIQDAIDQAAEQNSTTECLDEKIEGM